MNRTNIKGLPVAPLEAFMGGLGHKPYRARQIYRWLYRAGVTAFEQMTDLSLELREQLAQCATLPEIAVASEQVSADGTRKYLFRLADGETIETVWIPDRERSTLCVSTQVGCAMGCRFCVTTQGGLNRNLETWEIVEQLLMARRIAPASPPITNLVMMGMGEPLANLGAVIPALELLLDPNGISLAPRRVTVSTVGLVPQMAELGVLAPQVNLAVSLGAATDAVRADLIPVARRWPLAALMAACRAYPLPPRRHILFEYILIRGVNDASGDARELVRRLHGVRGKVNLMTMNPVPGRDFERPEPERVDAFQQVLCDAGIRTMVRRSRGGDILAACGQLRRTERSEGDRGVPLNLAEQKQPHQHPQEHEQI